MHEGVIWAENVNVKDATGAVFSFKIPKYKH